ncbi:MAG: phosphate acetyltransferase [Candidatus Cloacimonetes bacterium]|nr:phosphate acetyltransferase [Candidatus Cloacimonadota bacterium]MBT6994902.1 phosphate acetyltransferase [Candidatus Cloacimonadota bacterium]
MIRNFNELLEKAKSMKNKTVVITAAQTASVLDAAILAKMENIANSLLVGDKVFIENYLSENVPEIKDDFEIIDAGNDLEVAAQKSVKAVREGKADIILKGKCPTATLLKAVLDKEVGLRSDEKLSDVLIYEHLQKLILMSDGGINLYPNVEDKISIIKNAVKVAHSLEIPNPKVALLAAVEVVNPKMPATVDAQIITEKLAEFPNCVVFGPLAFDVAIDEESAKVKNIKSEVAGNADVLVVPNIEAGNIFGKSLTYYCKYRVAHVVMGAKVPILIASRADTAETKFLSMVLGVVSA